MSSKSTDVVKKEIDSLLGQCIRLGDDNQRRECIREREYELVESGWEPRDAHRVSEGVLWILDIGS